MASSDIIGSPAGDVCRTTEREARHLLPLAGETSTISSGNLQIDKQVNEKISAFEVVPSVEEVQAAISVLKQLFSPVEVNNCENEMSSLDKELVEKMCISNGDSKKDKLTEEESESPAESLIETAIQYDSFNVLQSQGLKTLLGAFSLMKLKPCIQKMVMSLSSDKAVWQAVMKNKAVEELRGLFLSAVTDGIESSKSMMKMKPLEPLYLSGWSETKKINEESDITSKILRLILDCIKNQLVALVGKMVQLVNELLGYAERKDQTMEVLDDMLRSTFMLTLLVLLLVVFSRIQIQ